MTKRKELACDTGVEKSFDGLGAGKGEVHENGPEAHGEHEALFNAGIASELFPLLLFIGIGAMIDFGPLLSNPKMFLFGG